MNYYNPYFFSNPYISAAPKVGLFSKLFGGNLSFGSILTGTQKTLNIVNQAIPLVKQAGPVLNNAKTMFRVMNEFKKVDTPIPTEQTKETTDVASNVIETNNENGPTFFV